MMNLFLKRILLFILPIVLLAYPLDYTLSSYLAKQNSLSISAGEYSVWNDIYKGEINAEIAVYGSSRAWVQFNTPMLSDIFNNSSYNFGVDGHNFQLQYLRHLEYLKYNKPPKTIILSVDFATLQKRKDLYNYSQLLPYMLWNSEIYNYTKDYEGFSKTDYKIPLVRYMGEFNTLLKAVLPNKDKERRIQGYAGRNTSWNNDFIKAQNDTKNKEYKIDSVTVNLFDKFLNTCKSSNIQVIMVYSPVYYEGFDFIENHQEIVDSFQVIANKHQLPFLDYTKSKISYNKALFYNSTHLNSKGADRFTNQLCKDVVNLKINN